MIQVDTAQELSMEQENPYAFAVKAAIGGIVGGILSSIPILNMLNCCFCLLNGAGAGLGVHLHLKSDPAVKMSSSQAAASGAISGVIAGIMASVSGALVMLIMGSFAEGFYRDLGLPRDFVEQMTATNAMSLISSFCTNMVTYPAFGAIFGVLTLNMMHKERMS
jgi:hypothetical protein